MNPAKARERVLVIPASHFHTAGYFHGFQPYSAGYFNDLLDPAHFTFMPRGEVEADPTYKQLIPYIVVRCKGEIFHYTRGSAGSEKRLETLRSIGVGGHISADDVPHGAGDPYRVGMLRELNEELEIRCPYREEPFGFIFDDSTPVGQVHLGVVHLLEVEEELVWARESAIDESGFAPLEELLHHRADFETWSQLVLEKLRTWSK